MTTATGLSCVDYLSPKFNLGDYKNLNYTFQNSCFQDTAYTLSKRDIYNEFTFQHFSSYLTERNSVSANGGAAAKRLSYTTQSCFKELRCNFTKLNLAEKFMQSCGTSLSNTLGSPTHLQQDAYVDPDSCDDDIVDVISCEDEDSCDSVGEISNSKDFIIEPSSFDKLQLSSSPRYSYNADRLQYDSDTSDTDNDEEVGCIFNDAKIEDLSKSRDFRTLSDDIILSSSEFRTISDRITRLPLSDASTDEEFSDSEVELALITSGVLSTNPVNKRNRKRSSDCLQEQDIKRPCIDVEKMHLSLSNSVTRTCDDTERKLFVPIDIDIVN